MDLPKIFIRAYKLVSQNVILVQPLLIFFLISSFLTHPISHINAKQLPALIPLIFSVFALNIAFISGWYCMFKEILKISAKPVLTPEQYAENSILTIKSFVPGVGKYFLQSFLTISIYILVILVLLGTVGFFVIKAFGLAKLVSLANQFQAVKTQADLNVIISSLSKSQIALLDRYFIIALVGITVWNYISLFCLQAVIMMNKSSLKAFLESFKAVFRYPIKSFIIFVFILFGILLTNILTVLAGENFIFQLVALIMYVYFMVYYVMVSFVYFEEYLEDIGNSRSDSI